VTADSGVVARMTEDRPLVSVELRPPRAHLPGAVGMDVWIDMYHAIQRLTRRDAMVFLTDNAVGQAEEENLGHLVANLGEDVDRRRVIPFLTTKHSLEYCQLYARRAASFGFEALTVLGGDQSVGAPRVVPHAYMLRQSIREHVPTLRLGGWANPHADATRQVDYLLAGDVTADFYLTQVVSHHSLAEVDRFVTESTRRGVPFPGVFGVFYYRSANPKTLKILGDFFPVPAEGVMGDFEAGMTPDEMCIKSIRALRDVGVRHVYISNLGVGEADRRYRRIVTALEAG
jgi:hypothetical protein